MSETQWPYTLHFSMNQENKTIRFSKLEWLVLCAMAIFQILDVPVPKPDVPVSTS
jgi:hypothetical protein